LSINVTTNNKTGKQHKPENFRLTQKEKERVIILVSMGQQLFFIMGQQLFVFFKWDFYMAKLRSTAMSSTDVHTSSMYAVMWVCVLM